MLYCPNPTCQTQNAEGSRYCQQCRAPLPHRYLWAVTTADQLPQAGQLLGDRYLYKGQSIFLDTLPGYPPGSDADQVPAILFAYLRLVGFRIHIPLVYDLVYPTDGSNAEPVLLLEEAALWQPSKVLADSLPRSVSPVAVAPLPAIALFWEKASGTRQLAWLWQIANLWQPLLAENVATSLLQPDLIRVEGSLIRLLELRLDDPNAPPSLVKLGHVWQRWQPHANAAIAPFLQTLTEALVQGDMTDSVVLIEQLDEEMAIAHRRHPRPVAITTLTDKGPMRSRNEDACYPPSGSVQAHTLDETTEIFPLAIVCDGIGGHQGGDVASNMAIATLYQEIQTHSIETISPNDLIRQLETSIGVVNDQISQRNDNEDRLERQRMGTTLVMGLLKHHELYLGHVGDSRAYWVTRWGCHQITLDDDVASRQVRMGQALYRQALQYPSSGSLVQALGMGNSRLLRPTVHRFLVDEDSVLLLCSDGLSDADRVEEHWDTEVLPILRQGRPLEEVIQRLVEVANTLNGHDNVTIALMHCQVPQAEADQALLDKAVAYIRPPQPPPPNRAPKSEVIAPTMTAQPTQVVAPATASPSRRSQSWLLSLGALALLTGGVGYFLWPLLSQQWSQGEALPSPDTTFASPDSLPTDLQVLPGNFVQVGQVQAEGAVLPTLAVQLPPTPEADRTILPDSVLQIVDKQEWEGQLWLKLRVCTVGGGGDAAVNPGLEPVVDSGTDPALVPTVNSTAPNAPPLAQLGDVGWLPETTALAVTRAISAEAIPQSVCDNPLSPTEPPVIDPNPPVPINPEPANPEPANPEPANPEPEPLPLG